MKNAGRQIYKRLALAGGAALSLVLLSGCHLDMWVQSKDKPYGESTFYADGQASRPLIRHTVDRDHLRDDDTFATGYSRLPDPNVKGDPGELTTEIPPRVLASFQGNGIAMLKQGQERFNIHCQPCHGKVGDGNGMIAQRGFALKRQPGNYHTDRLRKMPIGHFFDVITRGYGAMYSKREWITPEDRWAICAYIRALQLSQDAKIEDVPKGDERFLQNRPPEEPVQGDNAPGANPKASEGSEPLGRPNVGNGPRHQ